MEGAARCAPSAPYGLEDKTCPVQKSRMRKFFALFLAIFGLFLFIASSVAISITPSLPKILMAVAGVISFVVAYKWDERRERAEEARRKEKSVRCTELLGCSAWNNGRNLEIKTSGLSIAYVSLAALATICAFYSSILDSILNWPVSSGLALLSIILVFSIFRILPRVTHPALSISAEGISTPIYGNISWRNIGGIYLHRKIMRGQVFNHLLHFKVNHCAVERCHWTERILSGVGLGVKRRKIITVSLHGANEEPETILALARMLWGEKTGATPYWNPFFSEEYNQAMTRIQGVREQLKKSGQLYGDSKLLEKKVPQLDQLQRDFSLIEKENRWTSYRVNIFLVVSIIATICIAIFSK